MKTLTLIASLALVGGLSASEITISRKGSEPAQAAPASNFTGTVRVERIFGADAPARISGGLVHFEAGARTNWHTHPLGQTLFVTAGVGRVQQWGRPIQEIRKGDIVRIPPNVKHWHGASPGSAMSHLALSEQLDGKTVAWMEPLEDAQFDPPQQPPSAAATAPARPQLSRRDRSLVTVSALVAMNCPDQLRSHLALARQNGVTEEELSEAITHLAFYTGWPSAMSAAGVAKEVFRKP